VQEKIYENITTADLFFTPRTRAFGTVRGRDTTDMAGSKSQIIKILSVVGGVLILDRFLKMFVKMKLAGMTLVPNLFQLKFYANSKGPFSLPIPQIVIIGATILVLIVIVILIYKKPNFRTPLFFIIAGALSNLFDRIFYGYTIDTFQFLNFSFFNLADGLIFIGIFLLIYKIFKFKKGKQV
jgi:signal peptidase II